MPSDNERDDERKPDTRPPARGAGGDSRSRRPAGGDSRARRPERGTRGGDSRSGSDPRSGGSWGRAGRSAGRPSSRSRNPDSKGRGDSSSRSGSRSDSERKSYGRNQRDSGPSQGERSTRFDPGARGEQRSGRAEGADRPSKGRPPSDRPGSDRRGGPSRPHGGRDRDAVRRDDRRNERDDGSRRGDRSSQRPHVEAPEVPDDIHISQLDREVRQRLRTLSKDNAEDVGRHLVMAGALIEIDPELAYKHAQVAVTRGGRVDVVREAGALTAYATGRYAEALRELRTVRRLSGSNEHLPLMADCERGMGRPERAIDLARSDDAATLGHRGSVEMEIVAAGARLDLGQAEAAYVALKRIETQEPALQERIDTAMVDVLRALGRDEQAAKLEARLEQHLPDEHDNEIEFDITVYDVAELPIPEDDQEEGDDQPTAVDQVEHTDEGEDNIQAMPEPTQEENK